MSLKDIIFRSRKGINPDDLKKHKSGLIATKEFVFNPDTKTMEEKVIGSTNAVNNLLKTTPKDFEVFIGVIK